MTVTKARNNWSRPFRAWGSAMAIGAACLLSARLAADEPTEAHGVPSREAQPPGLKQSAPPVTAKAPQSSGSATGEAARGDIGFKGLNEIQLDIRPTGKLLPDDTASAYFRHAGQDAESAPRDWGMRDYTWVAPGLCNRPLYFEEIDLERHGHSLGLAQPAASSAQFYGRCVALPCLMVMQPPWECIYPLGHDRPGNCVPNSFYLPSLRR